MSLLFGVASSALPVSPSIQTQVIVQASTMSRSPHCVLLKCQAIQNALHTVQQSNWDWARWEWDGDNFPISPAQSYIYDLYPYSWASYDPETEWGTHYCSLKWEIPEVNDWNLTMMVSKLDRSAGEWHNWWGISHHKKRPFHVCPGKWGMSSLGRYGACIVCHPTAGYTALPGKNRILEPYLAITVR